MRITVIGAGVLGSLYAARLAEAGNTVCLVARGRRLEQVRDKGIELVDAASGTRTVTRVDVIDGFGALPNTPADHMVLAFVRAEQIEELIEPLRALHADMILMMTNIGCRAPELADRIGPRLLLGFPGAGGHIEGSVVHYLQIGHQKTTLGESGGTRTARLRECAAAFQAADFPVDVVDDMPSWLASHAAFIAPLEAGIVHAGGDPRSLAANPDLLDLVIRATREGFAALRSLGRPILPANVRTLYRLPKRATAAYWRRQLRGDLGAVSLGPHAREAPAELAWLARGLLETATAAGLSHEASTELLQPLVR